MRFALVLLQASTTEPSETFLDRMPLVAKYGIFALLLLVAVAVIETIRRQGSREREVRSAALAAGCTYHASDPAGIGDLRFVAFSHGKGTTLSNVVSRTAASGLVARAFDFSTYTEYTVNERQQFESEFVDYLWGMDGWGDSGGSGRKARRYSRTRTGAVVKVDAFMPALIAAPANLLTRAFERIGAEDLDFESEEFNRSYDVRCTDKRFASLFLDAQVIDFILDFDREFAFETFGNYVMCHGRRSDPRQMPVLAQKMAELVSLLSPLVYDEYPTGAGIEYRDAVAEWNRRPGGVHGNF
jgi:hypothetical protein